QELIDRKTPVDGIGVGTQLVTGSSHPTAGMVYKLVAIQHTDNTSTIPVAKASKDKQSLGGEKFISRDYKQSIDYIIIDDLKKTQDDTVITITYIESRKLIYTPFLTYSRELHNRNLDKLSKIQKSITRGKPAFDTKYITPGGTL